MAPRIPIRREMLIHTPVEVPQGNNPGWGVLPKDTGTVWSGRAGDWKADLPISGRPARVKLETLGPNQACRIILCTRQGWNGVLFSWNKGLYCVKIQSDVKWICISLNAWWFCEPRNDTRFHSLHIFLSSWERSTNNPKMSKMTKADPEWTI